MSFNIDQKIHSIQDVELLLKKDSRIELGQEAVARIRKCREYLDNRMRTQKEPIYGITTGFGSLCNVSVGADELSALQKNDYSRVQSLLIGDGKNAFPREKFDNMCADVKAYGGIAAFSYLGDMRMRPYHRLLWKVSFNDIPGKRGAGSDAMFEVVMINVNGAYRAVGFSFR